MAGLTPSITKFLLDFSKTLVVESKKELPSLKERCEEDLSTLDIIIRDKLMMQYTLFMECICVSILKKGITAADLQLSLQNYLDYEIESSEKQRIMPILNTLKSVNGIIDFLRLECASHLQYGVFEFLINHYKLDEGQKELCYYKQTMMHVISCPSLIIISYIIRGYSQQLNIALEAGAYTIGKLQEMSKTIAEILKFRSSTLQIKSIESDNSEFIGMINIIM